MAPPKGHPGWGGKPKGRKHAKTLAREAGQAQALEEEAIDAARTMREIGRLAFSDIGALFDDAGNLKRVTDLPAPTRATIASVKTLKTNLVSGDGAQETTREVKLWDKGRQLELLAKHFGLVTDRSELKLSGSVDLVDLLRQRHGKHRPE